MNIGDEIRRKDDHRTTARVMDIQVNYARGYGFGIRVKIFDGGIGNGEKWTTMQELRKDWEVIKDE